MYIIIIIIKYLKLNRSYRLPWRAVTKGVPEVKDFLKPQPEERQKSILVSGRPRQQETYASNLTDGLIVIPMFFLGTPGVEIGQTKQERNCMIMNGTASDF